MRPSTYTEKVIAQAEDYLKNYNATYGHVVPTVEGLCGVINRSKSTVYSWKKDADKVEFLHTLEAMQEIQACQLINGSLSNTLNANISKLMLANHGYHDKVDTDHTNSDGKLKPSVIKIVAPVVDE